MEVRSKPLSIVEFKPVEKEGRSKLLDEEVGSRPLDEDDEVRSKPVEEIASKPEPDKYQPEFVPVRCKPKSYPSILTPQESSANNLTKYLEKLSEFILLFMRKTKKKSNFFLILYR